MIPLQTALDIIKQESTLQPSHTHPQTGLDDVFDDRVELIKTCDLECGMVIAQDVISQVNIPSCPTSVVDGYAVIHHDINQSGLASEVVGTSVAEISGHSDISTELTLKGGQIARVTTGAPLPRGYPVLFRS